MSGLIEVRDAIKDVLHEELPNITAVTHEGRVTIGGLRQISGMRGPSAVVTCLGIPAAEREAKTAIADVTYAVFCVAQRTGKLHFDEAAMMIAQDVLKIALFQNWNSTAHKLPTNLVAVNLHTHELKEQGTGLWLVQWRQKVELLNNPTSDYDDFNTFTGEYDVGETDDTPTTSDTVDLT